MTDPVAGKDPLGRSLTLARLALLWERAWPALWPSLGILGGLLGLAWMDVLPLLAGGLHGLLVYGGIALSLALAVWRLRPVRIASDEEARRRVERDSSLEHRPLAALDDHLASGPADPFTLALWEAHRARMAALAGRLRVALPAPRMTRRDPWGLRSIPLLLLAMGLFVGWGDLGERLDRALAPRWQPEAATALMAQAWITPPDYTGEPPQLLKAPGGDTPVTVPAGSRLLALVQGGEGSASLAIDDGEPVPLAELGEASRRIEAVLTEGSRLTLRLDGDVVARWPLQVLKDAAPSIELAGHPDQDQRGRLGLAVKGTDDYGIVRAWVEMSRVGRPDEEPSRVSLPVPAGKASRSLDQTSWHDLTGHRWAGLPVTLRPMAEDSLGQQSAGPSLDLVLPERDFTHPVARALAEMRRQLAADPDGARMPVLEGLDVLSWTPDSYGNDQVAFLAMRVAGWRLLYDANGLDTVLDLLWQTALRIEEGRLPDAERALEQAAEALEQALADGASQAELDQLMEQLQRAMQDYLQALAERAPDMPPQALPPNAEIVTSDELQQMLEQMRDLAQMGSREAAQQMLSQMRDMMQGMQGMPQMSPPNQQAMEAMGKLGELAQKQQQLMDKTFQADQRGQTAPTETQALEAAQEALRRQLGETMRQIGEAMGEIPDSLGEAEQAMREAGRRLGNGEATNAVDWQGEALTQLRQGLQQAGEQLAQQMGGIGLMRGMPQGAGRDPLGRRMPSPMMDDESVKIPDRSAVQKSREVMEELRRRAGQPQRPEEERDYLRRLLKQF